MEREVDERVNKRYGCRERNRKVLKGVKERGRVDIHNKNERKRYTNT